MEKAKLEIFSGRIGEDRLILGEKFYATEDYLGVFRSNNEFYVVTETELGGLFAKECVVDPIVELTGQGPKMRTNLYFCNSFSVNDNLAIKSAIEEEGVPNVADGYIDLSGSSEIKAFAVDNQEFFMMKQAKMQHPERSVADSILIGALQEGKHHVTSRGRN